MSVMPHLDQFTKSQLENLDTCPWCANSAFTPLFTEKDWPYIQCDSCDLIYLKTRLKEEQVHVIYDQEEYHTSTKPSNILRIGEKRLDLLGKIQSNAVIFEDATGSGGFIGACIKKGLNASGCDLGGDAVKQTKDNFGINISQSSLAHMNLPESSVDYLASFNLLSHLYTPWDYLKECKRVLKSNGALLIRTGDRSGKMFKVGWGNWSAPEHVFHFPRTTLIKMIEDADMKVTSIIPAFDSDYPYWLSEINNKSIPTIFKRPVKYIIGSCLLLWRILKLPKDDIFLIIHPK